MRGILLLVQYWLPVALGWSLALVMHHSTGARFSPSGICLLLGGIGAAYSVDRLIDPPTAQPRPRWVLWSLGVGALLCAAVLLLAISQKPLRVLMVAALLSATSLLYPRLKRLPLVKTAAVALAWTWASTVFPLVGSERLAWTWWSLDVTLPLLLLLSAGCILCDLKDARQDQEDCVPSLPVLLGPRATCMIATGLALSAAILALLHGRSGLSVTSLMLAIVAQFPKLLTRENLGPILVDSILILPGVLIALGLV